VVQKGVKIMIEYIRKSVDGGLSLAVRGEGSQPILTIMNIDEFREKK